MKCTLILYFIVVLFYVPRLSSAQSAGGALMDSLLRQLPKAKNDTATVNLYNTLAYVYSDIDLKLSSQYAEKAYALANQLNWQKGIATAERMRGNAFLYTADFEQALVCYKNAIHISSSIEDLSGVAINTGNLGAVYHNKGNYAESLEHFMKALTMFESLNDLRGRANQMENIGSVYDAQLKYDLALAHYEKALGLYRQSNNRANEASALSKISRVYAATGRSDKALIFAKDALLQYETLENPLGIAEACRAIGNAYYETAQYQNSLQYWYRALDIYKKIENKREVSGTVANIAGAYVGIYETHERLPDSLADKTRMLKKAVAMLHEANRLNEDVGDAHTEAFIYDNLHSAYNHQGDVANALLYLERYVKVSEKMFSEETDKRIMALSKQREEELKQKELELRDRQTQRERLLYLAGFAGMFLLMAVIIYLYRNARHERGRSDKLLLNILPHHTANELKEHGHSTARDHANVSILFTDFVDFSVLTERMPAKEMVALIDHYYKAFDRIVKKHGMEKIKTIGDSYMAACGVPVAHDRHAHATVQAALEIVDFVNREARKRDVDGLPFFHLRIGVNSGPVVAGIVGDSKFAYDIWGETVNLAARMEQSGEPGKVNISGATFNLVKDTFGCRHRGKVKVKHGLEVEMYFVESDVPEPVRAVSNARV